MFSVFFIVSLLIFIHLIYSVLDTEIGFHGIKHLKSQSSLAKSTLPSVSIIFSALNEEDSITAALAKMTQLAYPQLEIIAIDDRSSDHTGTILENIAKQFPILRVIHITKLPDNWLGKNHALYIGAKQAKGEWLLFTDADVLMDRFLLVKTLSYALENSLDHLTIYEKHIQRSFWLKILSLGSYITYCLNMKPWRIRYGWSRRYLGHGAFNLVKKSVYQHVDGHRAIALECLDDFALGRLLKSKGYKQDTVYESEYIEREWYSSLADMIKGLSKNAFAYFDFDFKKFWLGFCMLSLYYFWPLISVLLFNGPIFWVNVFNIILHIYLSATIAARFRLNKLYAFYFPIAIMLLIYTVCYSMYLTYKHNGIYWRDTHYLLQKLRAKPVPADIIDE